MYIGSVIALVVMDMVYRVFSIFHFYFSPGTPITWMIGYTFWTLGYVLFCIMLLLIKRDAFNNVEEYTKHDSDYRWFNVLNQFNVLFWVFVIYVIMTGVDTMLDLYNKDAETGRILYFIGLWGEWIFADTMLNYAILIYLRPKRNEDDLDLMVHKLSNALPSNNKRKFKLGKTRSNQSIKYAYQYNITYILIYNIVHIIYIHTLM